MWAGVAGGVVNNRTEYEIAISIHDSVYSTDYAYRKIPYNVNKPDENAKKIEDDILETFRKFSNDHLCKFLGVGLTLALLKEVDLCDLFLIAFFDTFI